MIFCCVNTENLGVREYGLAMYVILQAWPLGVPEIQKIYRCAKVHDNLNYLLSFGTAIIQTSLILLVD